MEDGLDIGKQQQMSSFEGKVNVLSERTRGTSTFYSLALQGQDGFHNIPVPRGGKPPEWLVKGAEVSFDAELNPRGYSTIIMATLRQLSAAEPAATSNGQGTKKGITSTSLSILSQVALKMAVELFNGGMASGTIKKPQKQPYSEFAESEVRFMTWQMFDLLLDVQLNSEEEARKAITENLGLDVADEAGVPYPEEEGLQ